jgi:hypothetical protein
MEVPEHLHDAFKRLQRQTLLYQLGADLQNSVAPFNARRMFWLNERNANKLRRDINISFGPYAESYTTTELDQIFHN